MPNEKDLSKLNTKEVQALRKKNFFNTLKSIDKKMRKDKDSDAVISTIDNLQAEVKRFSTGSLVLDSITGGGMPHGRIIEVYGPEASGKTSIALNAIANVQREGGTAVFVDAEQALDTNYAKTLGVNLEELGLAQESIAENVLQMCADLADSGNVDLIVVDSVAALTPRQEAEGEIEKVQVALLARVMSKALRILLKKCASNNCTIIFLNQIREKVGVMFGNPETTPGGKALKFYASQRIEIRRKGQEKDGKEIIGTTVRMKVVKNKVAAPFKEGLTVLTFAHGINRPAEMIVVGDELNILKVDGRSYFYETTKPIKLNKDSNVIKDGNVYKIGNSKGNAVDNLSAEPDLFKVISQDVMDKLAEEREGIGFNKGYQKETKEDEDME